MRQRVVVDRIGENAGFPCLRNPLLEAELTPTELSLKIIQNIKTLRAG